MRAARRCDATGRVALDLTRCIAMSTARTEFNATPADAELRPRWGWFVALGVALLVLGLIAFGNLLIATVVSVLYVGALMFFGAVAQIIHAFRVRRWGGFIFWLLSGLLYGVGGFLAFYNPVLAAAVLTLLLAAALIASGVLRIWSSFRLRPETGWGWLLGSGVITLLAGIVVAIGWPVNTVWLLGLVLALDLTFQGVAAIAFGLALRASR
jgi:uncharacterized membrane protein HdeD (DUF308 family)